ncbi:anthranilate synthase component I [Limibaculum sp. M0105]|uniref:Anthranilate synthase component 1 n=1 Tax=Thermohalobaculum xanthum TaxID=2753746 RepID=A0A8J7M6L8_9RHOB|nr:anthranilate synthase component I [Thermohalobaculum xanthum]MBK0398812.1 anthranilate synthase component I [Thermohalobaculum xanthum]
MRIRPERAAFAAGWARGDNQIVWAELVADQDTPVSLMLKLTEARPMSFMLESVTGGEIRGRYSVIGFDPDLIWRCRGERAEINRNAASEPDAFEPEDRPTLASLRALIAESRIELPRELPPMAAGLFGYLGYDMIRLVERLPEPNPDPLGLPDAMMLRPRLIAIVDNVKDIVTLCAPVWHDARDADAAYDEAVARLHAGCNALDRRDLGHTPVTPLETAAARALEPASNTTHPEYLEMVERAKDYIRAGDIFQVVPSQRWALPLEVEPFSLYRALRRTNPSPYMFFFNLGGFHIAGASPEILVRVRDGKVTIRPIAGTRKRGRTPEEDEALEADLLADPKERAEHLMLLDLGRNDVGRVAKIGTVDPNEQFTVERYSHVMHIVSNVDGELREGVDAIDALLAGLPAGTVSGAPKIRAMEIIDELEKEKRGVYAGGVGYFSAAGEMDTCIALRTGVIKDGTLYVQAGGGVVYDSDPEAEFQETVNKSMALMHAASVARNFN